MQFSIAAVLAAATAVSAGYGGNITYTTEVVTAYTTYCPEPTTLTHGDKTYTITEATTLTITDCPCTISKPVYTTSVVECHDCPKPTPSEPPVYEEPPVYQPPANTTLVHIPSTAVPEPSDVPAGAAKAAALSGAGLAGVLGFAALLL